MPFKPGESGNPAGRPRQKPVLEWCKRWTMDKAEKYLAPIAEDVGNKNQLEAIKLLMAYGVGKPVETSIVEAEITPKTGTSTTEIEGELAELVSGATGQVSRDSIKNSLGS